MVEHKRETDYTVVFQTKEGVVVWSPLENGVEKMIKERESQGDRVLTITSSSDAKKIIREQMGYKEKGSFFKK